MEFTKLNKKQEALLNKLYYTDKILFGRDRLYRYVRDNHPKEKISMRGVGDWLKRQKVSQLFQQTKETKDIKRTVLKTPYNVIGVDLVDMSTKQYGKYKWLMTAIDLFTKKAWAIPLTDKTEQTVADGLNVLLKQMGHIPKAMRSDNGSEFIAEEFKKILKKHNITQILSKPHTPQSNGQVENFNKILKKLIEMDAAMSDNKNWVDTLPTYLNAYNSTPNRVTGKAPNDIDDADKTEVSHNIEKHILKGAPPDNKPKFKKGDVVRLKMEKEGFSKSLENWTRDLYMVVEVIIPRSLSVFRPSYKVIDKDGTKFKEIFYDNDLQLIIETEGLLKSPDKYTISKIINFVIKDNKPGYMVKWRGYKEPTWEPRDALMKDLPKIVAKFDKENNIRV